MATSQSLPSFVFGSQEWFKYFSGACAIIYLPLKNTKYFLYLSGIFLASFSVKITEAFHFMTISFFLKLVPAKTPLPCIFEFLMIMNIYTNIITCFISLLGRIRIYQANIFTYKVPVKF